MPNKIHIDETIGWQRITPGGDIYASGSSEEFNTGDWRTVKPVFIEDKCIQCLLCVPVCPDMSIPVKAEKRTDFAYNHCKGCGICAKVCPVKAIEMKAE
jgi:pyruvate ferredoxin oxidoreductase delta subunit